MAREFIDKETGELIEVASYQTKEQQEKARKKQEEQKRVRNSDKLFIFTEMDGVNKVELENLENKQLGYFLILQTFIDYNNMIRVNKLPMKQGEIKKALQITDYRTFNNLMNEFIQLGLIYTDNVEMYGKAYQAYFVNDAYCFKKGLQGSNKNRNTDSAVKLFIDSLQEVYNQKKVKASNIGIIYKAIQHLHYGSNVLAENPAEMNDDRVMPLDMTGFADSVGITRDNIFKKLLSLTFPCEYNGEIREFKVFAKVKVGRNVFLKLNPFVAWRQAGDPPTSAYIEFVMEYNKRKNK